MKNKKITEHNCKLNKIIKIELTVFQPSRIWKYKPKKKFWKFVISNETFYKIGFLEKIYSDSLPKYYKLYNNVVYSPTRIIIFFANGDTESKIFPNYEEAEKFKETLKENNEDWLKLSK